MLTRHMDPQIMAVEPLAANEALLAFDLFGNSVWIFWAVMPLVLVHTLSGAFFSATKFAIGFSRCFAYASLWGRGASAKLDRFGGVHLFGRTNGVARFVGALCAPKKRRAIANVASPQVAAGRRGPKAFIFDCRRCIFSADY